MKAHVVLLFLLSIIVLLLALTNGLGLLFRLFYALISVLLISYLWAWANVHGIEVAPRKRLERVHVGQSSEETLTARNTGRLPKLWVEVRNRSDLPGYDPGTVLSLPSGQSRTWGVRTEYRQRGRFTVGPLTLISGDPFGLFSQERTIGEAHTLLVYPATVDVPHFMLPSTELSGEERLRRRTHWVAPNASGVRDYTFGDSFNRIHWRSTARTGKLMVKEFELDPSSDIWILLDMHKGVQAGEGEESTEEYGVTIAASIAKRYLEANRPVGLIMCGEQRYLLEAQRGSAQLGRALESLALVKATGSIPLEELIAAEGTCFSRHTTAVVITASTNVAWVAALRHFIRRGVKVTVVLLDASSFGGASSSGEIISSLAQRQVPTYLVRQGEAIDRALRSPIEETIRLVSPRLRAEVSARQRMT